MEISQAELDGARPYSPMMLRVYDLYVLGFNNRFVWRCPTKNLRRLYDGNISGDHLDIGPGTGWQLSHAKYPVAHPKVTLVDLNQHPMAMTAHRLRKRGIEPVSHVGSVLQPLPVDRRYASVAASLLMHCVPGNWDSKGIAFRHIADATTDDGVFFGATALSHGVPSTALSRATSRNFQRRNGFHNQDDDLTGLVDALERAFAAVEVNTIGSFALWTARGPRRTEQPGTAVPGTDD
ncbi:class I SAM-dependent methyltransferase [Nocardia sp. NPDC060256]|uniref:class I SAM-dependent methyltransferase n=1 Tax=unclassified Nocardia TaxID=2637762 RepID=UPI003662D8FA